MKYYNFISECFLNTLNTFIYILIPSLFLMIIIAKLLKSNKYVIYTINKISKPIIKLFNLESSDEVFILFFSFLSGNPTSQILLNESYQKGNISKDEAKRLGMVLCFSSPIYLYKCIVSSFKEDIFIILIVTYLIPLLTLIIKPKYYNSRDIKIYSLDINSNESLDDIVYSSFTTLIKIFSFIFFFEIISFSIINIFSLNDTKSFILTSFIDLTVSLRYYKSINKYFDLFFFILTNTFLGLSIHTQINSVSSFINYKEFLSFRIYLSILCGIIIVLLKYNIYIGIISIIFYLIIILFLNDKTNKNFN